MSDVQVETTPSLEEQVALLKAKLVRAQRLSALGELASTTTHEFNNILTTIINYAKLGVRHRDDATRDKALDKILIAANRAAKITNSVLGVARNRGDRHEPVDLVQLIEDSLVLLERELQKYRVSVERAFQPTPKVMANANQIQQVILNLLINARQAMPGGGRVILRLSHDAESHTVELAVRDTGCGMSPETMRRIFDPYYSTKSGPDESGRGGTGLGLSACREIIESHRGRIRVESTLGKGTQLAIRLPLN